MVIPPKFRQILLSVALIAIPLLFLRANLKETQDINPVDHLLLRISAPIQSSVTWVVRKVHRGWRRYFFLVGLEKENERLLAENRKLLFKLKDVEQKEARLRKYEHFLAFRSARGVETVGARIISRQTSPFVRASRLQIDLGRQIIEKGLPVVTSDGVVGRVGNVYGSYADVILAVDPKSVIDIVIQRTGGRGILRGIGGRNSYVCKIDYLLQTEKVNVGDLVVTSGVAGLFPRDLSVGRISKVTKQTHGLYQEVEVTPTVTFSSLEEVLIILAPKPPEIPTAEQPAERARGFVP